MLQRIGNDINVPDNLFGLRREPARTFACGVLVLNGFFDCYKGDMQLEQKIDLQIRRSELAAAHHVYEERDLRNRMEDMLNALSMGDWLGFYRHFVFLYQIAEERFLNVLKCRQKLFERDTGSSTSWPNDPCLGMHLDKFNFEIVEPTFTDVAKHEFLIEPDIFGDESDGLNSLGASGETVDASFVEDGSDK